MPITNGTRLGPYEVVAPLGAGGMGEVWKARDTRLDRSVAIKVLPAEFAENAQLKLRFEREAKTISQLNHPHICTLYDVGEADVGPRPSAGAEGGGPTTISYLVMELLDGESLADRLNKGPLPIEQVLRYGIEIAEALDKAHKAGVVHRDLKPGNIMITKSGAKLLDFGLAKPNETGVLSALTSLRTERRNLTEEGTIVGTFQYMAPEQIEGGEVDARTDIFALGALLYEMATGRRAFEGRSKASLIASILTAEPQPISAIQPMTPATFDRVVRTCLHKDPDERWQSAHDVAQELRWVAESPTAEVRKRSKRAWIPWSVAALLAFAVLALGGVMWRDRIALQNAQVVRTAILPPEKTTFDFLNAGAPPAISPDGSRIVFGAREAGKPRRLWVRPLDSLVAQELAGTEDASFPFWSPDGRFIAFFADNSLKKMEVSGGAPVVLCNVAEGRGGSWSPDGQTIVFGGRYTPIYRVAAAGGAAVEITKLDQRAATHRWPEFLPDSRHFLFLAALNGNEDSSNTIFVGSIDGTVPKPLVSAANDPHYLDGCLVFTRDHILTAQPFDSKRLALAGDAFPLREQQVETTTLFSRSIVSISPTGTLVYQTGSAVRAAQLTWFDRTGKQLGNVGEAAPYNMLALAPDGKGVLTSYAPSPQANLWMFDLNRGVKSRVTFNKAFDNSPIWSPDGRRVLYSSINPGRFKILLRDLSTGSEETLIDGAAIGNPVVTSWSADGQRLLYMVSGRATRADIWWMSLDDRKPHLYLGTPFAENAARFSPDGKWVAYQSNETGPIEVYVAPFPPTGAKWQVSTNGGAVPRWRADGKELFYVVPNIRALVAAPITLGAAPQIGPSVKLFDFHAGLTGMGMYDVSRDGQRFLVNTRIGEEPPPAPLFVVQHFDHELHGAMEHHQ